MNTLPFACSLALASMSAAVASHWWSFGQFSPLLTNAPSLAAPIAPGSTPPAPTAQPPSLPPTAPPDPQTFASQPAPPPAAVPSPAQQEFFESLLDEMRQLKKTNLALRDQMAETNRDLMKLEFRVDTQSASFRPLPVTEEVSSLDTTSLDTSTQDPEAAVTPPRAVLVGSPEHE